MANQADWYELPNNPGVLAFRPKDGDWQVASRDSDPSGEGVLFKLNGNISTDESSRPNGYDPTGPLEGSDFVWYQDGYHVLEEEDTLEAEGLDTEGNSFHFTYNPHESVPGVNAPALVGITYKNRLYLFENPEDLEAWKEAKGA